MNIIFLYNERMLAMICKNCSHENAPDEKICTNCGVPLTDDADEIETKENETVTEDEIAPQAPEESPALEPEQETDTEILDEQTDESSDDTVDEDDATAEAEIIDDAIIEEDVAESYDKEPAAEKKSTSKVAAFSGLIALIAVCLVMWFAYTGIFAPKYDTEVDRSKFPITYVKDAALYQKKVSGQSVQVSDSLISDPESGFSSYNYTVKQSENGKVTYFLENFSTETFAGTLYATYNNKDKVKIADNVVQGYIISDDGKTVVYMADIDVDTAVGPLFCYTKGGEPQQIANTALYQTFAISPNGKYISFVENYNEETYTGEYYIVKIGSSPVKIDDEVVSGAAVSNKGETLYLKNLNEDSYTCDLYIASASKEPTFISSGVSENYVIASEFSNKAAFVTMDENQVYNFYSTKGGSEPKIVLDDIMGFFSVDVENDTYLIAKMAEGADPSTEGPNMLLKKKNKQPVTIAKGLYTPQHASASYDFKTIYYLNNYDSDSGTGTLNVRKEGIFGMSKTDVIAEGVSAFRATRDGKAAVYITNANSENNTGTINAYVNNKSKVIAENVSTSAYKLSQNSKSILYISDINTETYIGNLYCASTTGSSEPKVIDSDVYASFYSRSDKNAIYFKNPNTDNATYDLYIWKGRGTPEQIDTGISMVLFE